MALPILGAIAGTLLRGAGSMLARGGVALARAGGASGRTAGRVAQGSLNRAGKRLRKRKPVGSGGNAQQPTSTAPGGSAGAAASGGSGGQGQGQSGQSSNPLSMSPGIPNMMQDFADNLRQSSKGLLEFAASTGKASTAVQGVEKVKDIFAKMREERLGIETLPIKAREIAAAQRINEVTPTDKAMAKAMAELNASVLELKAASLPFMRAIMQNVLLPAIALLNDLVDMIADWFGWEKAKAKKDNDAKPWQTPVERWLIRLAEKGNEKKQGRP